MAQGEKNVKKCKLMCHYCVKVADNDLPVVLDHSWMNQSDSCIVWLRLDT